MKTWADIDRDLAIARAIIAAPPRPDDRIAALKPLWRAIYEALVRAADAGEACPTNPALAARFGITADAASKIVTRLHDRGLIVLTKYAKARDVTIVATGRYTAPYTPDPRDPAAQPTPFIQPTPPSVRRCVDRTPCRRCGVRGDLGCAHQQPHHFEVVA